MRRLRAGLVTLLPGGPGQPSARTMTGCLQWLDARDTKGGGSRPDRKGPKGLLCAPARKHGLRGLKDAARGAPRGAARSQMSARTKEYGRAAWRATPSIDSGDESLSPPRRGGKAAYPGPQTIRAMTHVWITAREWRGARTGRRPQLFRRRWGTPLQHAESESGSARRHRPFPTGLLINVRCHATRRVVVGWLEVPSCCCGCRRLRRRVN